MSDLALSLIENLSDQIERDLEELVTFAESLVEDQDSVHLDRLRFGRVSGFDVLHRQAIAMFVGPCLCHTTLPTRLACGVLLCDVKLNFTGLSL